MSNKSDELRSRLPRLAAELAASVEHSISEIRRARGIAEHTAGDVGLAWKKGLDDALILLRPAADAHDRFAKWLVEVLSQEVDACGLTAAEREELVGPVRSA
jgi:hypothetical protein